MASRTAGHLPWRASCWRAVSKAGQVDLSAERRVQALRIGTERWCLPLLVPLTQTLEARRSRGEDNLAVRSTDEHPGGSLVFHFMNEKPIAADDLGRLFVSLARDYRKLTGRRLVVTSVVAGTLTAVVMDAVIAAGPYLANAAEVAKAINGMIGLGKALKERLDSARTVSPKVGAKKSPGEASLGRFLKVVERSGGEGQFEFESGREKIKATVTSGEAIRMREQQALQRAALLPSPEELKALPRTGDTGPIVDRLASIGESDLEAVVPVLVEILRSNGLEYQLGSIADELDVRGHGVIAQAIRAEMGRSNRRLLPPMTRE